MNKTQEMMINALVATMIMFASEKTNDPYYEAIVTFTLRNKVYALILSEEGAILYLKHENHIITSLGMDVFEIEQYSEIVKILSKKLIEFEKENKK